MTRAAPVWLFVAYGGGHVKALLPVAQRAQAQGLARVVFLALTTAAAPAREAGVPTYGFADLLEPSDTLALQHGERLVQTLSVQAAQREESVAYLGLSYAELEADVGAAEAAARYAQYGRQAFLPVRILERAIACWQPACVLTTNSPRAERAALLAARRQGVPSVCLLDLFGLWERDWLVRPDYADALCVLNPQVAASLIAAGRPADHVHVTGNPAFDSIHDPAVIEKGHALRREAGWSAQRVVLYASSPEPEEVTGITGRGDPAWPRRIETQLIEAVQRDPALALWVRRHPSEAPADDIEAAGHPRIRVAQGPLHPYLHACDEVVVTVSTVGVEGNLAGREVTQVRGSILDGLSPYRSMGIAQRELTLDQMARQLAQPAANHARAADAAPGQAAACAGGGPKRGPRRGRLMARIVALPTPEAQARFERLPPALRIASLSPIFAAADTQRAPTLRCVHACLEGTGFEWIHNVHLRPLSGEPGQWGATSPYGYGGPITPATDPALLAQAWAAWQTWCREEGVLAEFCRFHPQLPSSPLAFGGTVRENRATVSVDLSVPDVTAGFNSLTRRKIRRTQQAGVQTRWSREAADWGRYAPFYRQAMQDVQATAFYFFPDAYFEALARLPYAHLLVCEREGRWLSAGVYLLEAGLLEYHLGASSPEGKDLGTPSLLQAQAAAWGQAQGAQALYLAGGTDPAPDNPLLFYKLGFSRRTLPFSVGEAIHDDNRYWAAAARLGFDRAHPPARLLLD